VVYTSQISVEYNFGLYWSTAEENLDALIKLKNVWQQYLIHLVKYSKIHLRNLGKSSLMMWMLKEMKGKQRSSTFPVVTRYYDKDSTWTINHNSILKVNKSDSLHVHGGFWYSLYPYETISCLCILQQSVVRFTMKQHIVLLLLFFYCLRNIYKDQK